MAKTPITIVKVEIVLTITKSGSVKKWVPTWITNTLMTQATREGWGNTLDIKSRNVRLGRE